MKLCRFYSKDNLLNTPLTSKDFWLKYYNAINLLKTMNFNANLCSFY